MHIFIIFADHLLALYGYEQVIYIFFKEQLFWLKFGTKLLFFHCLAKQILLPNFLYMFIAL
jgi:hypothetical protein